jgi:hypothetical protein
MASLRSSCNDNEQDRSQGRTSLYTAQPGIKFYNIASSLEATSYASMQGHHMARNPAKGKRDSNDKEEKRLAESLDNSTIWRECMKILQGTLVNSCRGSDIANVIAERRGEPGMLHRVWTSTLC